MSSNPSVAHQSKLPALFVDDLGPLGVPDSKPEDYGVPPKDSELSGGVYWVTSGWYD